MAERVARDFAAYGGRISAVVAHHHWDGGHCYVDTPFVSNLSAVFPGSRLEHMGFGEFYLTTKEGRIDFDRMRGKDFPGQSGRSHRLEDEVGGRIVEEAVKRMEARGLSVDSGM
jgi:hypothetical protein